MRRILFVDDEPFLLDSLRAAMRRQRHEWEMAFVAGAEAALAACRQAPFDVVVTDLHMPRVDGAALLEQVQLEFPDTVRIVLSGSTGVGSALPVVKAAHQYLAKPCDSETLKTAIDRTMKLRSIIADDSLRKIVGQIGSLPSQPVVLDQLLEQLKDADASVAQITNILEADMAMCAKLLQIANSAFFGLPHRMTSVADAVSYLGTSIIRDLVLTASIFSADVSLPAERVAALQEHALLTGAIARRIMRDVHAAAAEDAFMAGMLHDVGILVIASRLPGDFKAVQDRLNRTPGPLREAEIAVLGVGHAELGAYLLSLWGLPFGVVEAVAAHDRPAEVTDRGFELAGVTYIADHLAQELEANPCGIPGVDSGALDQECLRAMGVDGALESWREWAQGLAVAGPRTIPS